jgi:hypothetical protein
MAAGSPPAGALFRDCAAEFGVKLDDPSAALGSAVACRAALLHAGFVAVEVETGTVRLDAGDHALAWESNLRSAGHAAVQGLSATELDALRQRYLSALERASRLDRAALEVATAMYASGRCPQSG